MAAESKKKLQLATFVYWILLVYTIAALIWWAFSLIKETETIYQLRKEKIQVFITEPSSQKIELLKIEDQRRRSIYKYVGEGATFLVLIMIGAVFIYRSVRRQFRQQQQQQNFVMAITHELKTPIAVSKLNLETLQKYQLDDAKRIKLVQMTLQETTRLDNLINNILVSAQIEGDNYKLSKEEINLSDLTRDVVQQFSSRYPGRQLQTDMDDDVEISGDPVLLKLLISNLLENAHKYSPAGTTIFLSVHKSDGIKLAVIDEGYGIADDEKKNVFKKFYRIGTEQTRKTQGTGLGLYLCKKIANDHGGTITIEDNSPSGAKFIIHFPS